MIRINTALGAALLCCISTTAFAQVVQLDVAGGTGTDTRGISSSALTVAPSVTLLTPGARLQLGASATRFGQSVWSLGGSGALGTRASLAPRLSFTLDANAGLVSTSYDTRLFAAEAVPALELALGPVTAFGGVRGGTGSTTWERAAMPGAGLLGRGTAASDTTITRRTLGALYGAVVQLPLGAASPVSLQLRVAEERSRLSGAEAFGFTTRTAGLGIAARALQVGAHAGVRSAQGSSTTFGAASVSYALRPGVSLEGATGWQPTNLLTGALGGRFATLGISLRTGGPLGTASPAERGARTGPGLPPVAEGMTRLAIRARDARSVELAGDFNEWRAVKATRAPNGVWYADLRIAPGRYRYAFRVDGRWQVPDGVSATEDDFGGRSAWLTVDAPH